MKLSFVLWLFGATAVFIGADQVMYGMAQVAKERGIRLGEDLSIISHDDVLPHLLAENFAPPLTVTRQPIRDAGPILAAMMMARLAGTPVRELQRTDKVDLIVRGSTGPAPKWGGEAWSR